jgi:hypothetical protein
LVVMQVFHNISPVDRRHGLLYLKKPRKGMMLLLSSLLVHSF